MSYFYSPSTGGFYTEAIHGQDIPSDACAIDADRHARLMAEQSAGLAIVADADGRPVAMPPPAPSDMQLLSDLRRHRDHLLAASDFTQMPDAPLTNDRREAWRLYRQALRDLPETATDLHAIEWPVLPSA
ncbi:phage tail assembly chaperone [Sphingobium sp. AS12]|uniref:tail fiber assembly protein n=1 Tax=Sphingobium sp. AS12 TaxID=2849495 RepID=UPI001C31EA4F|nr:tail fiber assembly protein [Sphingobium sp. AS12]MBV2149278.1 phage tail assembly chaperone [Sphingobium sp. AS12]